MLRSLVQTLVATIVVTTMTSVAAPAGQAAEPRPGKPGLVVGGHRCTIVGTKGDDVLRGTARDEVICGRGGDDVIDGRGGNDRIFGGGGDDRIKGGSGRDVLKGGTGADRLDGGGSDDRLAGGWGGDLIAGRAGDDDLDGDPGDDELDGGPGADDIDGGPGDNACVPDGADTQTACRFDLESPSVLSMSTDVSSIDVTDDERHVRVTFRAADDTGIRRASVSVQLPSGASVDDATASLVSGTRRDGTWVADVVFRRWSEPGSYDLEVFVSDAVGRWPDERPSTRVQVTSSVVDRELPRSQLLAPAENTAYDARTTAQHVPVRVRVTDDLSGVDWVSFCLYAPLEDDFTNLPCVAATRVSGTARDGIYETWVTIPARSVGGTWNLGTVAGDRSHGSGGQRWTVGPDVLALSDPGYVSGFPGGRGRIQVVGITDTHAPVIESVALSTRTVDTLDGSASVVVTAHVTDAVGEGVHSVYLYLAPARGTGAGSSPEGDLTRVAGTVTDGVWRATLTLPQGTPPGTYYLSGWVRDGIHLRDYVASEIWQPEVAGQLPLVGETYVTVVDD